LAAIDLETARQYFREAQAVCDRDNGQLWGVQLFGPLLLVHPESRLVVSNLPDMEGNLIPKGDCFVGHLPEQLNTFNGVLEWAGVKWTMLMWPLPDNRFDRRSLIAHELWHRIQGDIGFPATNPQNDHLDTLEGRYWLQLEWRALREALEHRAEDRTQAVEDVRCFREMRRDLFRDATDEERALEMHEGLAQYTGIKLASSNLQEAIEHTADIIDRAPQNPTFVRSFAYASGPAYGLLLDASGADWRKNLKPTDDFGPILQQAYSIEMSQDLKSEAESRSQSYDGASLLALETERERRRREMRSGYHQRLVDGPVLILPNLDMNVRFDPRNLLPLGDFGTVYPTVRVTAKWGMLEASNGALIAPDWRDVRVAAPADPQLLPLSGDGWTLELNEGWELVPAERTGDYTVGIVHE